MVTPSKWYCQPLEVKQAILRERERYRRWMRNPMCRASHERRLRRERSRRAYRRRYMRLHPDPAAQPVSEEERCIEWALENAGPDSRLISSLSAETEVWTRRGRSR